jgi:hypothetical protein
MLCDATAAEVSVFARVVTPKTVALCSQRNYRRGKEGKRGREAELQRERRERVWVRVSEREREREREIERRE